MKTCIRCGRVSEGTIACIHCGAAMEGSDLREVLSNVCGRLEVEQTGERSRLLLKYPINTAIRQGERKVDAWKRLMKKQLWQSAVLLAIPVVLAVLCLIFLRYDGKLLSLLFAVYTAMGSIAVWAILKLRPREEADAIRAFFSGRRQVWTTQSYEIQSAYTQGGLTAFLSPFTNRICELRLVYAQVSDAKKKYQHFLLLADSKLETVMDWRGTKTVVGPDKMERAEFMRAGYGGTVIPVTEQQYKQILNAVGAEEMHKWAEYVVWEYLESALYGLSGKDAFIQDWMTAVQAYPCPVEQMDTRVKKKIPVPSERPKQDSKQKEESNWIGVIFAGVAILMLFVIRFIIETIGLFLMSMLISGLLIEYVADHFIEGTNERELFRYSDSERSARRFRLLVVCLICSGISAAAILPLRFSQPLKTPAPYTRDQRPGTYCAVEFLPDLDRIPLRDYKAKRGDVVVAYVYLMEDENGNAVALRLDKRDATLLEPEPNPQTVYGVVKYLPDFDLDDLRRTTEYEHQAEYEAVYGTKCLEAELVPQRENHGQLEAGAVFSEFLLGMFAVCALELFTGRKTFAKHRRSKTS